MPAAKFGERGDQANKMQWIADGSSRTFRNPKHSVSAVLALGLAAAETLVFMQPKFDERFKEKIMVPCLMPAESIAGIWELVCFAGTVISALLIWVCSLR